MDDKQLGQGIKAARLAKDWTQADLAKRVGVTRNAVCNWEGGGGITSEHLLEVVKILDSKSLEGLTTIKSPDDYENEILPLAPLRVRGEIKPRAWLEIGEHDQDGGEVHIFPNPRYAGIPQFALRVAGKPREYVIVAAWEELGREPRINDCLAIRREMPMTYEITVKRVRKGRNGLELWPDPADPKQEPMPLAAKSKGIKTTILGLVIGHYREMEY